MKVGDLVRVFEHRGAGGLQPGAIGLVLAEDKCQPTTPRWTIMWLLNNKVTSGHLLAESMTYGYGIEVISEAHT